jgi:hypothetical protein
MEHTGRHQFGALTAKQQSEKCRQPCKCQLYPPAVNARSVELAARLGFALGGRVGTLHVFAVKAPVDDSEYPCNLSDTRGECQPYSAATSRLCRRSTASTTSTPTSRTASKSRSSARPWCWAVTSTSSCPRRRQPKPKPKPKKGRRHSHRHRRLHLPAGYASSAYSSRWTRGRAHGRV